MQIHYSTGIDLPESSLTSFYALLFISGYEINVKKYYIGRNDLNVMTQFLERQKGRSVCDSNSQY